MFDQIIFGEKLKNIRKEKGLTQDEVAEKIGVSGQAVSKWEKGECLPDVYNLKLFSQIFRVSLDSLLETEEDEKIIETYKVANAVFELVQKPAAIYAGKMTEEITNFYEETGNYEKISGKVLPERDIHISLNFWSDGKPKKIFFARETRTEEQSDGIEVYKIPKGLFLRAYTDKNTSSIIGKDTCEPWELFSYMWNYIMPKYNLKEARNADGEDNQIEIYDSSNGSHGNGWAYAAVARRE